MVVLKYRRNSKELISIIINDCLYNFYVRICFLNNNVTYNNKV